MVDVVSVNVKVVPLEEHWKRVNFVSPCTTFTPSSTGALNTEIWKSKKSEKADTPSTSIEEEESIKQKEPPPQPDNNSRRRVKPAQKHSSASQRLAVAKPEKDVRESHRKLRRKPSKEHRQTASEPASRQLAKERRKKEKADKIKPQAVKNEKMTCHWEQSAKSSKVQGEKQPISEASPAKPLSYPPDSSVFRKRRSNTAADKHPISNESLSVNQYFEQQKNVSTVEEKSEKSTKLLLQPLQESGTVAVAVKKPTAGTPKKAAKDAKAGAPPTPVLSLLSTTTTSSSMSPKVAEVKNSTERSIRTQIATNKSVKEPRKYEVPELSSNLHRIYSQKKKENETWAELRYWFVLGVFMTILALYRNHLQTTANGGSCRAASDE